MTNALATTGKVGSLSEACTLECTMDCLPLVFTLSQLCNRQTLRLFHALVKSNHARLVATHFPATFGIE